MRPELRAALHEAAEGLDLPLGDVAAAAGRGQEPAGLAAALPSHTGRSLPKAGGVRGEGQAE